MNGRSARVRFAPSPTGDLHVGNARTALFNFLFARHHGGKLILRIEDTDEVRTSRDSERRIIEDLKWLGMDWDEGPGNGGPYGPYHQRERLDLYSGYLKRLIEADQVYPCYCTEEELEAERAELIFRRMTPRYRGKCLNLSEETRHRLTEQGCLPAYRFRVNTGDIAFTDMIRGEMKFDAADIGDFIVVRSNGVPAYNFAVVVDDHLMNISHVIRGEDHLSNTALQLLIYRALDFKPPSFAHHSLILGKDRSKLSKRHGAVAVREFRQRGVMPEALLNYLAMLGGTIGGAQEVCALDEMIASFSLDRAGKSGAVFDEDKLKWLNGIYIRNGDIKRLTDLLLPFLEAAGYQNTGSIDRGRLERIIDVVRSELTLLSDIGQHIDIFCDNRYVLSAEMLELLGHEEAYGVVRALREILDLLPEGTENIYERVMEKIKKKTGLGGKKLFLPIRAAVTGKIQGPELDKIFAVMELASLKQRVEKAIASAPKTYI